MSGTLRGKATMAAGIVLGALVLQHLPAHATSTSAAARAAIRYARHQLGKPYLLGATGPGAFDCSGLVMEAYAHAGISIPRTTFAMWAQLPHIPASQRKAGDIELIVGSDGTWQSPGHVVLLISRNKAIEAYGSGYPIRVISLRNPPPGDQNVVGFADPLGGRS